jgi:hypothetical protein
LTDFLQVGLEGSNQQEGAWAFPVRISDVVKTQARKRTWYPVLWVFYGGVMRTVVARQERREPQLMGWRVLFMQTSMAVR